MKWTYKWYYYHIHIISIEKIWVIYYVCIIRAYHSIKCDAITIMMFDGQLSNIMISQNLTKDSFKKKMKVGQVYLRNSGRQGIYIKACVSLLMLWVCVSLLVILVVLVKPTTWMIYIPWAGRWARITTAVSIILLTLTVAIATPRTLYTPYTVNVYYYRTLSTLFSTWKFNYKWHFSQNADPINWLTVGLRKFC